MRMSQEEMQRDYDERKKRCNDGVGSDEDRRVVRQYERDGFIESRLLREQLATQAAREQYARERASVGEDEDEDDDGPDDGRLTERSKVGRWREFAVNINEQLGEDAPIEDVTKATKRELIAAYGNYAQQSTQE
jgi:hypothetical protein